MDTESLRSEVQRDLDRVNELLTGGQPCLPLIAELSAARLPLWREAAEAGVGGAQWRLGSCYEDGVGVEQDVDEAVRWYRKAAEQGDPRGQTNLGICYDRGSGVEQDKAEAVEWFRRAAEQGLAWAQNSLGLAYV